VAGGSIVTSRNARLTTLSALVMLTGLITGCGNTEFKSAWRDRQITVDGKDNDWTGVKAYSIEDPEVSLGLLNDESHLYLLVKTHDRSLLPRLIGGGLTVWLDLTGKKNKTFGIRFPIGHQGLRRAEINGEEFQEQDEADTSNEAREGFSPRMEAAFKSLEVIGPAKGQRCTLALADAGDKGVEARIALSSGQLVYELEVPLRPDGQHSYAIFESGLKGNQHIGLGFETGKFEGPRERRPPDGGLKGGEGGIGLGGGIGRWGGEGGGWGRRGGMGGFGGGMGRRQGGPALSKGLDLWATVKLAAKK
jgi:hypothetical protein